MLTKTITLAQPLSPAGAHSLAKQLDQMGKTKQALRIQELDIPEGARLRRVGEARRDFDALLWDTVITTPMPMLLSFKAHGQVEEIFFVALLRTELRASLKPKLVVKARHTVHLFNPEGDEVVCTGGARLHSVGDCRRDDYSLLLSSLRNANEAIVPIVFTHGVDSQAVEQNWRLINRHKATLRHAGPEMYLYLLHRLGHLLNQRRWA